MECRSQSGSENTHTPPVSAPARRCLIPGGRVTFSLFASSSFFPDGIVVNSDERNKDFKMDHILC